MVRLPIGAGAPALLAWLLALVVLAAGSGCATMSEPKAGPSAQGPAPGTLLDGAGQPLDQQRLGKLLDGADVVLAGETHDHPGHHQVQLKVLRRLAEGKRPLVVGIEWLEHGAQPACDALSAGEITVAEFAKRVDWRRNWGYPLKLYAPILEEVRSRGIKLVALNAPLSVVRQVARGGLKSLTPEQRAQLAPAMDLDDPAYRAMVARQFAAHGVKGRRAADNFLAAQVARDETMAHYLARAMTPWPDGRIRGLVLAGSGHLVHGLGLVPRIKRRLPGAVLLTVLPVSRNRLATGRPFPAGHAPADVLWVTEPAPPRPPRLGVMLKAAPGGLKVMAVVPGMAAQKAGVEKGDLLLKVDGVVIKKAKDIHNAIKSAPMQPHRYLLRRGANTLEIEIDLSPDKGGPGGR